MFEGHLVALWVSFGGSLMVWWLSWGLAVLGASSVRPFESSLGLRTSARDCEGVDVACLKGLGHLGDVLGPSWGHLSATWGRLGPSWGHLGAVLGRLGAVLGPSWAVLGRLIGGNYWALCCR